MTTKNMAATEEFESVSGSFEEIVKYYQYNKGKKPNEKAHVITEGDVIVGTYEGSFVGSSKYKNFTHKIRTVEGLVGLTGAGQLNKALAKIPTGTRVRLEYLGKAEIKKGEWAGSDSHNFDVKAAKGTKLLEAAAPAGITSSDSDLF